MTEDPSAELEKELAQYGSCDPAKIDEKRRAVVLAKEAAVRWTGMSSPCVPSATHAMGVAR